LYVITAADPEGEMETVMGEKEKAVTLDRITHMKRRARKMGCLRIERLIILLPFTAIDY
jgi:hypothetical protein